MTEIEALQLQLATVEHENTRLLNENIRLREEVRRTRAESARLKEIAVSPTEAKRIVARNKQLERHVQRIDHQWAEKYRRLLERTKARTSSI